MMVLVRDAAAPCHPVIGLAALSSAAIAITAPTTGTYIFWISSDDLRTVSVWTMNPTKPAIGTATKRTIAHTSLKVSIATPVLMPNAGGEPRPIAGATQERKLLGVGSSAWFGQAPA